MSIQVSSEIGKLKKVLLHRPGKELEHLSPNTMENLLFDDIPYLQQAQKEHDHFASLLRENGAEVVYLEDLAAEALEKTDVRDSFIREFIDEAGDTARGYRRELTAFFSGISSARELVTKTMEGIPFTELFPERPKTLAGLTRSGAQFLVPPMPNLYFTRDPFASIGNGVSIHRMFSETRRRETIYAKYIFRSHPDYAGKVSLYYSPENDFSIEGGDLFNLSSSVAAVGISQRTRPEAIEKLAASLFSDEKCLIDTVLAMDIPHTRASMHLDTVFTQVDHNTFTIHPGILPSLKLYELKKTGKGLYSTKELDRPIEKVLEACLRLDSVRLLKCGGDSEIASNREQWNDGSNTLCLEPGTVFVYDRNYITNEVLSKAGIRVIPINGSELSRGRGGPRCMSMPLYRENP